jgi:hypothetical protein
VKVRILATGPSMSQGLADSLRGLHCIAVNFAFRIAPWAMALVANDIKFWDWYRDAYKFAGRKFSTNKIGAGVEWVMPFTIADRKDLVSDLTSSAVLAVVIAINEFGAEEIELHGVDNRGGHFHGDHPAPLNNPDGNRFAVFAQQFAAVGDWAKAKGVRIVNKTPGSALECFERA